MAPRTPAVHVNEWRVHVRACGREDASRRLLFGPCVPIPRPSGELSRDDRPPWGARSRPRASDFPRNTEHDADLSFLTPIHSLQATPSAIATSPFARTRRPPSPPPPRAAATGEPPSATPPPPTAPAATSATSRGRPTRSPSSVSVHSIPPTRAARVEPTP